MGNTISTSTTVNLTKHSPRSQNEYIFPFKTIKAQRQAKESEYKRLHEELFSAKRSDELLSRTPGKNLAYAYQIIEKIQERIMRIDNAVVRIDLRREIRNACIFPPIYQDNRCTRDYRVVVLLQTYSERTQQNQLNKKLSVMQAQNEELHRYEEKMHHLADQMIAIDLDDGVKMNYAKFGDVLGQNKMLNG